MWGSALDVFSHQDSCTNVVGETHNIHFNVANTNNRHIIHIPYIYFQRDQIFKYIKLGFNRSFLNSQKKRYLGSNLRKEKLWEVPTGMKLWPSYSRMLPVLIRIVQRETLTALIRIQFLVSSYPSLYDDTNRFSSRKNFLYTDQNEVPPCCPNW